MDFTIAESNGRLIAYSTIPARGIFPEYVVGWDICADCMCAIVNCQHDIPVEPSYITAWRLGLQTVVSNPKTAERSQKISGVSFPIHQIVSETERAQQPVNVLSFVDQELVDRIRIARELDVDLAAVQISGDQAIVTVDGDTITVDRSDV
jgi:hypothetical protein